MAVVAYLLVLVGGELSDDENVAFRQTEKLNELVRARGQSTDRNERVPFVAHSKTHIGSSLNTARLVGA